jgi:starch synthase
MKIAFAASEAVPFAKTGGLADVAGALTKELARRGHDVVLFLPYYAEVEKQNLSLHSVGRASMITVGDRALPLELRLHVADGVRVVFLVNDYLFRRPELYRDPATGGDWADNDVRFIFFARGILEACRTLDFAPDIVHANDWQSALLPMYLATTHAADRFWQRTRTLFTVHNIAYQGMFDPLTFSRLGVDAGLWYPTSPFEYWGRVNFLKLGLEFAESLSTVSERYAEEIRTSNEFGYGMEGILATRARDLYGIVNGIDYEVWNPATDPHIAKAFTPRALAGKKTCKAALQKEMKLPVEAGVPLVGIISRLADQKGFDLIEKTALDLLTRPLQMVVLGTGDAKYHELFTRLAQRYPERLAVSLKFDNGLAHRIEAGSDMFLMPSRYEPCGLNQLYSLKYGTIPIVRTTGGLADTIAPYGDGEGTGFRFDDYSGKAMVAAIDDALRVYGDARAWKALMQRAMNEDFSWDHAASRYLELYGATQAKKRRTPAAVTA